MIDRLQVGDSVDFTINGDSGSTEISGEVSQQVDSYPFIRVSVSYPPNHHNVTLVGGDTPGHRLVAHRDYTWEYLGTVIMLNVSDVRYQTVICAR